MGVLLSADAHIESKGNWGSKLHMLIVHLLEADFAGERFK
jgi:hypothetical protein